MEKYKIVFCGELQEGHDLLSVKARLASLFKIPGVVVDKLFQGKPVLVRTGLKLDTAHSFRKEFERTGARCQMLEVSQQPQPPAPPVTEAPGAVSETPGEIDVYRQSPPDSRLSTPPSPSPAAAARQFSFRQATPVREKNNTLTVVVTVLIIIVAFIFLISLFKKSNVDNPAVSSRQGITHHSPSRSTPRSTSPPPQQTQPAARRGLLSENTVPFQDPKNHYSVNLPEGCRVVNQSTGQRSKVTYSYSFNTTVIIIATPMSKKWDPQKAMSDKVTAIQDGKAGELSRYTLDRYGLVNFNELDGYEIVLSGNDQLAHAYALISPNNVAFAISIVTMGGYKQENHDILDSIIRSTLSYQ
jgi:hypothetical protein